jgi:hypothetical protein
VFLETILNITIFFSFAGAFLFAKAVLSAKERKLKESRIFALGTCLVGALQQATAPNVTFEHWLFAVLGLIGLVWLGLKFGSWWADRDLPSSKKK